MLLCRSTNQYYDSCWRLRLNAGDRVACVISQSEGETSHTTKPQRVGSTMDTHCHASSHNMAEEEAPVALPRMPGPIAPRTGTAWPAPRPGVA